MALRPIPVPASARLVLPSQGAVELTGRGISVAPAGAESLSGTVASLRLPDDWRVLPLAAGGLAGVADRPADRSERRAVAAALSELVGLAGQEGVELAAVGRVDLGPDCQPAAVAVVLAIRPAGFQERIDQTAGLLEASGLADDVEVGIVRLPLAGPCGRLAWAQAVTSGSAAREGRVEQYWVPFPEDDRTVVLTAVAIAPRHIDAAQSRAREVITTLAFRDPGGTVVIPR